MDSSLWKPHVTVAAIVERSGSFLLVEEDTVDGIRFNQPAGHIEPGESLIEAVIRETYEETSFCFTPTGLVGIYQWMPPRQDNLSFIRFAFCGTVGQQDLSHMLDQGIITSHWLAFDDVQRLGQQLRSPMVVQSMQDYLKGHSIALDCLKQI